MSYNPVSIINALKSVPDVTPAAVAAVKARIAMLLSITLAELLPILVECGMTAEQVFDLRETLESLPAAAPVAAAAASGTLTEVLLFRFHLQ